MNHGEKQKIRPLYDSLIDYGKTDYYPYHMPGHKRNGRIKGFSDIFRIDITEIDGFDNLHRAGAGAGGQAVRRGRDLFSGEWEYLRHLGRYLGSNGQAGYDSGRAELP